MHFVRSSLLSCLGFAIILIVAFVVNSLLGISGFEMVYRDTLVTQYAIQGEYLKGRIEASIDLGKKLYLLDEQINPLFDDILNAAPGIERLFVADASSRILYASDDDIKREYMPFTYYDSTEPSALNSPYTHTFAGSYYICFPLFSEKNTFEGSLFIAFSQETVSAFVSPITSFLHIFAIIVFLIACNAYLLLWVLFSGKKRAETIITVLLLLISQAAYTTQSSVAYNRAISQAFNNNMTALADSISGDIQKSLDTVSSFERLSRIDTYIANRIAGNPQCSNIYITDSSGLIYFADDISHVGTFLSLTGSDMTVMSLQTDSAPLFLVLLLNRSMISGILRDMLLDSATIIIVAFIFAFIMKDFFALMQGRKGLQKAPADMSAEESRNALRLIKISTFVFMFAAFETLSFIPLYIQKIYTQSSGIFASLTADTVISLPVGSYMLGIMIAMFITLFLIKEWAIKSRYIFMTIIFIIGSLLTIVAGDIIFLICARLVAGFGFGGILLSTSSLVIAFTSEKTRSSGFGTNAAGFAAASIAAIPIGGVIVSKFGYTAGIAVSIVFALLFLLFAFFCLPSPQVKTRRISKRMPPQADVIAHTMSKKSVTLKDFFRILVSPHVVSYIFCINIPFQLIYVGLFQFLLPLYMSDTLQLSQGNIGRILCVFSIVSLTAASISRLSDRVKNDTFLIALGAACVGLVLIVFNLIPEGGLLLFIAVMIAMGIDNVFIDAIEEVYVASGDIADISEENLLQTYKTIEKIISVFIPTLTGIVIMVFGFAGSMSIIGTYSLFGAIAFLFFGKNKRWKKTDTAVEKKNA